MRNINKFNASNQPIGYWEYYDGDGKIQLSGFYDDNGNKIGIWATHDRNGNTSETDYDI